MKKDKYGPQTEEDLIAEKWLKQYSENIANANRIKKGGTEANPNEPLKYVIYARKSSEDEDKQKNSEDDQIKECINYATKQCNPPLKLSGIILKESKSAYKSGARKEFYEMIDEIKKPKDRKYNAILAWSPDRLARNMKDAGEIIDLVDSKAILDIKFPKYHFTNDANGKMALGINFVLAKMYSENLSYHTIKGNRGILRKGEVLSHPQLGYRILLKDGRRLMIPDGENFQILREEMLKVIEGYTLEKVAKNLNERGFTYGDKKKTVDGKTLSERMVRPIFAGIYVVEDEVIDFREVSPYFEPMFSPLEFMKIREKLKMRGEMIREPNNNLILFRRIIRCEWCDRFMTPNTPKGKGGDYYLRLSCTNLECKRHTEEATRQHKKYKVAVRGDAIFQFLYKFFDEYFDIPKDAYKQYLETAEVNLKAEEKSIKEKIRQLKTKITKSEDEAAFMISHLAELQKKQSTEKQRKLYNQEKLKYDMLIEEQSSLSQDVEKLENELGLVKVGIRSEVMSLENFSNTIQNLSGVIRNTQNQALVDEVVKMVFSNIWLDSEKVSRYQLNQPFDKWLKGGLSNMG